MSAGYRIVIPARLSSSRLPNKPLLDVVGKTLIERVWDVGVASAAASVLVATEDHEVQAAVESFGGSCTMTASTHESGTDRLAEVVRQQGWADDTIVVNLQGDEPMMPPSLLDRAASLLESHPDAGIATFATPLRSVDELFDPGVVKVVLDIDAMAHYFSRAPIPWIRDDFANGRPDALPDGVPFLRHLGLYAYRAGTLRRFAELAPTVLERAERLEQLRALQHGIGIAVGTLGAPPGHGVDTPADLERVRSLFSAEAS